MLKQIKTCSKKVEENNGKKQLFLDNYLDKFFILDCSDKYECFLKELGVSKNVRIRAIAARPKVSLSKQNDEYVLSTVFSDLKDARVKFKPGQTVTRKRPGGAVATSVFRIVDNKLIEEQQVDEHAILIERTFTKKNLTVTMEVNDVKCHRMYSLSTSKHSIDTETSRRSSMWRTPTSSEIETSQETEILLENITEAKTQSESEDLCF